jgi:TATA-box binding protein (TBP) (component of TFIID and TFIIIB)
MEHLRVSTITCILQISTVLDLKKIYDLTPITKYIPFIEYGAENIPKGFSKKMLRKKRKKTIKKMFYNQATLHVFHDGKIMNVKLFNNGKIQITGLKKENQGPELIKNLIDYFYDISMFDDDKQIEIINHKLVLINSDFDLGFQIDREELHNEIIDSGIYSSYEPCIYPGVNIKYFINQNQFDGICSCNSMCNGKGRADGDGNCKKITIAVFKSGKVIITGGQNINQIETSYRFIKNFIDERKDIFRLKQNKLKNL